MIRIVGYLVSDASMTNAEKRAGWFVDWIAPPNLSSSSALKRAATRMATWEQRLSKGSYNGVTRVALEAIGEKSEDSNEPLGEATVRVLEVSAPQPLARPL